ncbi:unnamed protein product [Soboliphyme baturini]|uniref:Aa_trans domain-containing protein n=1 Tax=Soboliphyme baturini TaxID=241478 RepID=A0A183IVP9_9BILA|nr:unnamed protein product [Soboliphyme baturini]
MPNAPRPIKVNLIFPIAFFIGCVFLVIVPIIAAPVDTLIGIAIMLTSVPVYFVFVRWHTKPAWINDGLDKFTLSVQKLFLVVPEERHEE